MVFVGTARATGDNPTRGRRASAAAFAPTRWPLRLHTAPRARSLPTSFTCRPAPPTMTCCFVRSYDDLARLSRHCAGGRRVCGARPARGRLGRPGRGSAHRWGALLVDGDGGALACCWLWPPTGERDAARGRVWGMHGASGAVAGMVLFARTFLAGRARRWRLWSGSARGGVAAARRRCEGEDGGVWWRRQVSGARRPPPCARRRARAKRDEASPSESPQPSVAASAPLAAARATRLTHAVATAADEATRRSAACADACGGGSGIWEFEHGAVGAKAAASARCTRTARS